MQDPTPGVLIPKNPTVADAEICTPQSDDMNSYKCLYTTGRRYVQLISESLDSDRYERMIAPVYITSEGPNGAWTQGGFFNNTLNAYMMHGADGFYIS